MFSSQVKNRVFLLEGLNAVATTYYFYYAYFFMRDVFGFSTFQNLVLAAGLGFVYTAAAILGGRFGRRHGYFLSLKIGFLILGTALSIGSFLKTPAAHIAVMVAGNIGMCFTWPALQSIVSENETRARLQSLTGIYNLVWASGSAFAYFIGGSLIEILGRKSMFLLPAGIHFFQLAAVFWLERKCNSRTNVNLSANEKNNFPLQAEEHKLHPTLSPKTFLKMAWLTNPFAYVAVNTVIAIIPTIANRLQLSPAQAGFCCSIWFIVRAVSFAILRAWPNWHYRFDFLAAAYIALIASFAGILLAPGIFVLIVSQLFFGFALSLIYYSSLFYAMDVSEAKGDNAGFHEGMIGLGTGLGPAVGAAALYFFPQVQNASAIAVSGLLFCGLCGLIWLRVKEEKPLNRDQSLHLKI